MRPATAPLLPSSSLPPLASIHALAPEALLAALQTIVNLYCPLPVSLALASSTACKPAARKPVNSGPATPRDADSGYASATEDDAAVEEQERERGGAALWHDAFERAFSERWLTGFISRAEQRNDLQDALDYAYLILEALCTTADTHDEEPLADQQADGYVRNFSFELVVPGESHDPPASIDVQLEDHLAGTHSSDHEDVGLQSWGASIVFARLICTHPETYGVAPSALGPSPRIIDLGAGTGLVSMVLCKMLPQLGVRNSTVLATDYHPAVLENLRSNIAMTLGSNSVVTCLLDWSAPVLVPPLDRPADMLIATDVVYAAQHAVWLRDCATQLLAPGGTFWLVATVRQNGRFDGICSTVEKAFTALDRPTGGHGRVLAILHREAIEKPEGIGRGDESGYEVFKIGWAY